MRVWAGCSYCGQFGRWLSLVPCDTLISDVDNICLYAHHLAHMPDRTSLSLEHTRYTLVAGPGCTTGSPGNPTASNPSDHGLIRPMYFEARDRGIEWRVLGRARKVQSCERHDQARAVWANGPLNSSHTMFLLADIPTALGNDSSDKSALGSSSITHPITKRQTCGPWSLGL
jgi:hypothetical protein